MFSDFVTAILLGIAHAQATFAAKQELSLLPRFKSTSFLCISHGSLSRCVSVTKTTREEIGLLHALCLQLLQARGLGLWPVAMVALYNLLLKMSTLLLLMTLWQGFSANWMTDLTATLQTWKIIYCVSLLLCLQMYSLCRLTRLTSRMTLMATTILGMFRMSLICSL